jgi:hypothetical protein
MPDTLEVQEAPIPAVETAPEPASTPEPQPQPQPLTYVYQPTDEEGRNIGGKQVIKYTTQEELTSKLAEQNTLLIRKLRLETRRNRLGISEQDPIPDEAPRFTGPVEFKPRELTNDERYQLSRDLMDPAKAIDAQKTLFEASVGLSPERLRDTLQNVQQTNMQLQAMRQADLFVAANPGYYKCQENFDAITGWLIRYDLEPVKENFQRAYDTLTEHGVLVQGPGEQPEPRRQEPPPAPAPAPAPEIQDPPPAPALPEPARLPSGLFKNNSSGSGTPTPVGSDIVYKVMIDGKERVYTGIAAVNAMPSDEYKRRLLHERGFGAKVDKLDEERQRQRQSQGR